MGLLSMNVGTGRARGGLLSSASFQPPPPADAIDEWFLRRQAERAAVAAPQPSPQAPMPAAPAPANAPPQAGLLARPHVNPARVLSRFIFGGVDPFTASDQERARLEAEQMRPQLLARQAQLRAAAEQMGPAAMIAFETNPEKFGEALAQQYQPTTTSAGGISTVFGTGASVAAPSFSTVNDTIFRNDPASGLSSPAAMAPPAFSDVTARYNAEHPVLSKDQVQVGPDGQPVAYGVSRPDIVNVAPGGEALAFGPDGQVTNRVASTQPREAISPQDAAKARGGVQYIQTQAQTVRAAVGRARQLARTPGAVGFFGGLPAIPGTPGADLEAQLATIKSNLTQQALAQMRANSPTGGALGSVSDRENDMLAAGVASLNRAQSPAQFNQALDQIEQAMANLSQISEDNYQATYGAGQGGPQTPAPGQIEDGYRFKGGDPANPASWEPVQ